MATKLSTLLSNIDAAIPILNDVGLDKGRVRVSQGTIALATGDIDSADVIGLCRIPTNARILEIWLANDDLDSGGTPALAIDVGVYENGSVTAKDADIYANDSTELQSANTLWAQVDARTADLKTQRLWEDAGDTEDPGGTYDIAITVATAAQTAAAGDLAFKVEWVVD